MGRFTGKTFRLSAMLTLTFMYFFVEIVYGYLTGSMALVADSFHMLSDVLALIIAFFCMKISKLHSSKNTFGWVRAEVLGALVNSVFLLALCFSILVEALKRLFEPEAVKDPQNILIVGAVGLAVNIIGIFMFHGHASVHGHSHARPVPLGLDQDEMEEDFVLDGQFRKLSVGAHSISVLSNGHPASPQDHFTQPPPPYTPLAETSTPQSHGHSHGHKDAKKESSGAAAQLNMHGVFLHILGDAIGSVIVMINAIIVWQVENEAVAKYLDPSLSIVLCCIIVTTTVPLLRESALILLQTVPTHLNVSMIQEKLLKSIDGVLAVHEFHVWRLAGNKIIASAHIRCRSLEDYMQIAEKVKQFFHLEGIHSTTIQPEFVEEPSVAYSPDSHTPSTAISSFKSRDECILECPREMCAPSTCCGPSTEVAKRVAAKNRSQSPTGLKLGRPEEATGLSKSLDRLSGDQSPTDLAVPPKNRSFSASVPHDNTTVGGFVSGGESDRLLTITVTSELPSGDSTNL